MKDIKILVIQHGDTVEVLASTVICQLIKKQNHNAIVHMLVNSDMLPLLINNPYIDEIIEFKKVYQQSAKFMKGFVKAIREAKYKVVIDASNHWQSGLISWKSKAPIRISFTKWYNRFFYTRRVPYTNNVKSDIPQLIQNRLTLLTTATNKKVNFEVPKIHLNENEMFEGRRLLDEHGLNGSKLIMIGLFDNNHSQSYPDSYMCKLIKFLTQFNNAMFLINTMPGQKHQAIEFVSELPSHLQVKFNLKFNAVGIRQFLLVLNHCNAFIGNEGDASNMAKALGVPTFGIVNPMEDIVSSGLFKSGPKNYSVHLEQFKPELYQNKSHSHLKSQMEMYFQQFTPDLILPKLAAFCNQHL
ncbi:MAG: glycosyltransferase family 9 protein [Marinicella sp.]|nr:glycosyltransferase family 9 protein [Xanthomonadales bacterium]